MMCLTLPSFRSISWLGPAGCVHTFVALSFLIPKWSRFPRHESKRPHWPHKTSTMSTPTPTSKRKRGGSPSPSSSNSNDATSSTMTGYGLSLLSSVTKSVTKRMRLGYDYALGGGTTNGDSASSNSSASTGGGADTSNATPAAHAHKSPVPRREFGSPKPAGGVGGIGSPPFAAGLPAASNAAPGTVAAGTSAAGAAGGGGTKKVGFTPFSDGKKTSSDGKSVLNICL